MKTKDRRQRKAAREQALLAQAHTAMPTAERLKHAGKGGFTIGGEQRGVKIFRMLDAPIEQLLAENKLTNLQYEALRRLRLHWYCGHLAGLPHAVDLNRVAGFGSGLGQGERELLHREAFDQGWRTLALNEHGVVGCVVLSEYSLALAGSELGYSSPYRARQAALELLLSAADRLAKAWRM
jgi:hypothetical protein